MNGTIDLFPDPSMVATVREGAETITLSVRPGGPNDYDRVSLFLGLGGSDWRATAKRQLDELAAAVLTASLMVDTAMRGPTGPDDPTDEPTDDPASHWEDADNPAAEAAEAAADQAARDALADILDTMARTPIEEPAYAQAHLMTENELRAVYGDR